MAILNPKIACCKMSEKHAFPYLVLLPTKLPINKDCETPPHPDLVDMKLEDRRGRNLLYKIIEKNACFRGPRDSFELFNFFLDACLWLSFSKTTSAASNETS